MQKLMDILEKYVEWVALAIGGLFLAAMVALYLIGTPISTKLGDKVVTPATVDDEIRNGPASRLEAAMQNTQVPNLPVPSYTDKFIAHMAMKDLPEPALASGPWLGVGAPKAPLPTAGQEGPKAVDQTVLAFKPPVADPFKTSMGKTNVSLTGDTTGMMTGPVGPRGAAGYGPPAGFMPPGFMPPGFTPGGFPPGMAPPQISHPPTAGPTGGVAKTSEKTSAKTNDKTAAKTEKVDNKPKGSDRVWVSQAFTISAENMKKAFEEAKAPSTLTTAILRVEMVREEQLGPDSWGNSTVVKALQISKAPKMPSSGDMAQQDDYLQWASQNSSEVLIPGFYPQLAGDRWYAPGQDDPNKVVEVKPVPTPAIPGANTNRRMRQPSGMPGMPGGTRRGRSTGGPGGFGPPAGYPGMRAPLDGMQLAQANGNPQAAAMRAAMENAMRQAAAAGAGGMPGGPGGPMGMPPGAGMGGPGGSFSQTELPEDTMVPQGEFAVSDLTDNIIVWAHDDSVEPGKIYRYRMRYWAKNPVYRKPQLAGKPEEARKLAVASEFSEWSDSVTTPVISQFFVSAGVAPAANSVKFDIFHWQDGSWHMKPFSITPGDVIGSRDGDVNYDTGWTLVDLTNDPVQQVARVVVSDPSGNLSSRTFRDDQSDEAQFKKSIDWVDPDAPVKQPAATGYPGGPPPGMGGPPAGMFPGMGMPPGMGGPTRTRGR